jgi:hypothetical protein
MPIHGRLTAAAAKRLVRALTARRCGAPKLTAGAAAVLTNGFNGRSRGGDKLAMVMKWQRQILLRKTHKKQNGAKLEARTSVVGSCGARGAFYRVVDGEARR